MSGERNGYFIEFTDGRTTELAADAAKFENAFIHFFCKQSATLVNERTVRRGFWPFRHTENVREEQKTMREEWAGSIKAELVAQMYPIALPASGTRPRENAKRSRAKPRGPVPKGDAHA